MFAGRLLTMNISLPKELEERVKARVASGLYSSVSEVVREALRLQDSYLENQDKILEELRAEINIGLQQIENGQTVRFDPDALREKARQRILAKKNLDH